MGVEFLAFHAFDEVGEAVGLGVEVGVVDLEDVAGEDDFGAFAGAGDDGFDFVGGEVLGFVDDEVDAVEAAAADVGEGGDDEFFVFEHFADLFGLVVFVAAVLVLDDGEVVVHGLHVGVEFGFDFAGEVADVFVAEGDDGACEVDLAVGAAVFEAGGEGEEGFAGAGFAGDADEGDVVVEEGGEGEGLFGVAGGDAEDGAFVDAFEGVGEGVEGDEGGFAGVFEDEVFVGDEGGIEGHFVGGEFEGDLVHGFDDIFGDVFDGAAAGVEGGDVGDVVGFVVLGGEADGFGLHAEVDVFADEDEGAVGFAGVEVEGDVEDLVVGFVGGEEAVEFFVDDGFDGDADGAAAAAEADAFGEEGVAAHAVEAADEFAGVEVDGFVAFFEVVEFFEDGDGEGDVVFLEVFEAAAVVEDDVGVEDEEFFGFGGHRGFQGCFRGGGGGGKKKGR